MPAKSKAQQRLMGMVHAYHKGTLQNPSEKVKEVAEGISDEDATDFAKTDSKDLPTKVDKEAACDAFLQGYLYKTSADNETPVLSFIDSLPPDALDPNKGRAAFEKMVDAAPLSPSKLAEYHDRVQKDGIQDPRNILNIIRWYRSINAKNPYGFTSPKRKIAFGDIQEKMLPKMREHVTANPGYTDQVRSKYYAPAKPPATIIPQATKTPQTTTPIPATTTVPTTVSQRTVATNTGEKR